MKLGEADLLKLVPAKEPRAVARLITLVENGNPIGRAVLSKLHSGGGKTHVIGITGAPGAGKSTLVDQMAEELRARGKSVAIIAVDPTSPFTGGAVLGDRIRMNRASEDPSIFIRSMATRGSLGGLSRATIEAIHVLDCAGFDYVLVETVGVGQAEVDIIRAADTCVVVLVPGMGDGVQIIKAGLIEVADLFVINKADREGADLLERDLRTLMSLSELPEGAWKPEIVRTVAINGDGRGKLIEESLKHGEWLKQSTLGHVRKKDLTKQMLVRLVGERAGIEIESKFSELLDTLTADCVARRTSPYQAVEVLQGKVLK